MIFIFCFITKFQNLKKPLLSSGILKTQLCVPEFSRTLLQLLECRTRVKLGEDLVQFLAAPKLLYTGRTDLGPCFLSGLTQFARFGPVGPGYMLVLQQAVIRTLSSSELHGGKVLPWHFVISISGSPHPAEDNHCVDPRCFSCLWLSHFLDTDKCSSQQLEKCCIWWKDASKMQFWFQLKSCPKRLAT